MTPPGYSYALAPPRKLSAYATGPYQILSTCLLSLEVRSIAQCKCHQPKYAFSLLRYHLVT